MISEEASSHYTHSRGSHTHTVNYLYKTALSAPKTPTNKSKRQKQTSARPLIPVEGGVKMGLGLTLCVCVPGYPFRSMSLRPLRE